MSIFRALRKVTEAAIDSALLPVDVVADCLGVSLFREEDEPYFVRRTKKIANELAEAIDESFDD